MVKAIVLDLDDTLLRSDKTISDYTIGVLKKCGKAGIKIVFATARSSQAARAYFERFAPDAFAGYGGALVMAGEKMIRRFDITADIADRLIKECLNTPEITGIHAINESVALSNHPEPDMRHYRLTDFSGESGRSFLKISVIAADPAAVERIAARFPMCDMLRYTGENLYRFASRDAVKWKAVEAVSDYFGCDTADFIAFGDDVNDLEMIRNCGVGVAVRNAVPKVLAAAKYICESNDEDGAAKWIVQNLKSVLGGVS